MTDPKLIELVARGMCEREGGRRFCSACHPSQACTGYLYESKATAALAAIDASGTHWVAPYVQTPAMLSAGQLECRRPPEESIMACEQCWDAMRTAYLARGNHPESQAEQGIEAWK